MAGAADLLPGLLFVLPGAAVVLALSMLYAAFGTVPLVAALFFGIKAAVLAIVIEALLRVARRALKRPSDWWIAGLAFLGALFFELPFPAGDPCSGGIVGFCAGAAPRRTPAPTSLAYPLARQDRDNGCAVARPMDRSDRAFIVDGLRPASRLHPNSPSSSPSSPSSPSAAPMP